MNRGVPPTDLNALTGEFTPPGITEQARSNSFFEVSVARGFRVLATTPVLQRGARERGSG
jgi:hypothetical protein